MDITHGGFVHQALGFEVDLPLAFDDAMSATRDALKAAGFGVLTEIDMQAAFKEKLGEQFRRYTILGACNPTLAFAAINEDPAIGLLLPCNVTVESVADDRSHVRIADPQMMLSAAPRMSSALRKVAEDARTRMEGVVADLARMAPKEGAQ